MDIDNVINFVTVADIEVVVKFMEILDNVYKSGMPCLVSDIVYDNLYNIVKGRVHDDDVDLLKSIYKPVKEYEAYAEDFLKLHKTCMVSEKLDGFTIAIRFDDFSSFAAFKSSMKCYSNNTTTWENDRKDWRVCVDAHLTGAKLYEKFYDPSMNELIVRGEVMIDINNINEFNISDTHMYLRDYALRMISKNGAADYFFNSLIHICFFEIMEPVMSVREQYKFFDKYDIRTPNHFECDVTSDFLRNENITKIMREIVDSSSYICDGIVITATDGYIHQQFAIKDYANIDTSYALRMYGETYVKVVDTKFNDSKLTRGVKKPKQKQKKVGKWESMTKEEREEFIRVKRAEKS